MTMILVYVVLVCDACVCAVVPMMPMCFA